MNKNIKIITALGLSLFAFSCGFKPLNQNNNSIIHIQNFNIIGDQKIAYSLKNNIFFISNSSSTNKYDVEIEIKKQKSNKIKDKTAKVIRYSLTMTARLKLININKDIIEKTFVRNGDYDVASIHSDTINNEKNTSKIITQQLSDDIVNFITLIMRNK
jgi:hypothetical protein